jgi:hypothetical protein
VPLPTADRAAGVLDVATRLGYGERDLASLFEVLKQMPARPRIAA